MLDHMLTGAPLPKDDDSGEEDAPRDRSGVDVAEQPVKMKQQQQQQQQQQYSVRSKAPLPPSKRLAASKQRHVSPQQQRGRAVRDPSPQNQLMSNIGNIGTNYHRRSPSPAYDDGLGDAIVDINEAAVSVAPASGQVIPR